MKKITFIVLFLLLIAGVNISFALEPLVQCGNPGQPACNLCSFLELVKILINFSIQITFAFAGLFITWGAFVIMTAGGAKERVSEGKKMMTTAIIGMVVILTAWMVLGTVIQIITGSPSKLPWTEIKCNY